MTRFDEIGGDYLDTMHPEARFGWSVKSSLIPGYWVLVVGRMDDAKKIPSPRIKVRMRDRFKADEVGSAYARYLLEMFIKVKR